MNKIPDTTIIAIAGTVGVGKTTLTKALAKRLNFQVLLEDVDTNPYLNLYYNDFER